MKITVLGASGALGLQLTQQALERGHDVVAVARTPERITVPDSDRLYRVAADVHDPHAMSAAVGTGATIVSGLGIAEGEKPGALTAGARAAVAGTPVHVVWVGAFGTGQSAPVAGGLTRTLLGRFMREEIPDRVGADTTALDAGGTVFHAGPYSNGALSDRRRTLTLGEVRHRMFPARISRATVAAAMLDEAEAPKHFGQTVVPLEK
ncbi:NAD(P)H-binding protein [Streptomyces sp. NPDC051576]|uniref:NAD(P)-dependent oxidoreductase n=1 Tax=Streptomyces sp. NPDC051576 TaxID=3155803 RepID=UPI003426FAFF